MRTGPAAGHRGYFHEAAFYSSDEEFLALVVPFLHDGLAAGEPTVAALATRNTALVRMAMGRDAQRVRFVPRDVQYTRPAAAIRLFRELLAEQTAQGAAQIRVAGEVAHAGSGVSWRGWARYEAAVNHAYAEFPLWGLCPYDTRVASPEVLADVARTHPHLATPGGGHDRNPGFEDPSAVLSQLLTAGPLPDAGPPALDVVDPTPGAARGAIRHLAQVCGFGDDETDDAVLAASEAVVNALHHGVAPVRMRAWPGDEAVTIAVTDAGAGPSDPFAGLLPVPGTTNAGFGMWLVHQLCRDVTFHRDALGFTVRMVVPAGADNR